ncbi:hypothetical protein SCUP515_07558 [Seiridium cupressi]
MLTEELTVQSCLARPLELVVERMVASFATSDVVSSMVSRGPVFPYHSEVISQQMASAGWCPAELRVMSDSFTGLELWRLSFLEGKRQTTLREPRSFQDKSQPKNIDWTAISHVWSDGLGNNKENAIPLCQFDRLCRLTSALPVSRRTGSSPFWLDTLCFPLQPKAAYDKALVRMKECYEDAKAVLVLDHYLLGAYARGDRMSMTEVMARIIISPWNRRLWTWQEAYLAHHRHLFFQFKDITICDEDILDAADGRWVTKVEHFLDFAMSQGFHSRFQDIRDRNDRMSIMDKIAKSKNSLTFRSTSVAPDEALALSNILGINTAVILNCKHQKDWMLTFWKHVTSKGHYHASMIFWDGPRQGLPLGTCDIYGREQDISATEMGPPRPSRHGNIHSRLAC